MPTINRTSCTHCGQTINEREIGLYSGMVKALVRIYYTCSRSGHNEFTRKEIKPLFKGKDSEIARWGDWVIFGNGMVYKPHGKGTWGLNMERVRDFIDNKYQVNLRVLKRGKSNDITVLERGYISDVPNLSEFLDEAKEFISKYV